MKIEQVQTRKAPAPVGHYSQAVVYGGLVYISGQVATNPATGEPQTTSIEAQTEQALQNVQAILQAADSDLERVLKMTIYISDISLWDAVNTVYANIMGSTRPARAIVPVKELGKGLLIEIEAIAAIRAE
ncbi:MAG: RidA family protein [Pyrinomonadaceae bacterium]|nr:RidA family protein [Pyrinomonadaceae bacterium]